MTNSVVSPDPALIRCGGFELPVEEIRGHRLVVIAHRGQLEPFAGARLQAVFLHQPDHTLPADLLVLLDSDPREYGGLPYRCLLSANDAWTSTFRRRSSRACVDSGRCRQA